LATAETISRSVMPDAKLNVRFAVHFKKARRRCGFSQTEAALEWNVPVRALRNWEQGLRAPNGPTLLRLLPVLFPQAADVWIEIFGSSNLPFGPKNADRSERSAATTTRRGNRSARSLR
jgi:DNA-binding transcriptional regulator YiaG